jgi:hypothetical protein
MGEIFIMTVEQPDNHDTTDVLRRILDRLPQMSLVSFTNSSKFQMLQGMKRYSRIWLLHLTMKAIQTRNL